MFTLVNKSSEKTFDEVWSQILQHGAAAWGEVTCGRREWVPDTQVLSSMYEKAFLKILTLQQGEKLCGHLLMYARNDLFCKSKKDLIVLSVYVRPEYRREHSAFLTMYRYLHRYAVTEGCDGIVFYLPQTLHKNYMGPFFSTEEADFVVRKNIRRRKWEL